jgi:hypothetical protein
MGQRTFEGKTFGCWGGGQGEEYDEEGVVETLSEVAE